MNSPIENILLDALKAFAEQNNIAVDGIDGEDYSHYPDSATLWVQIRRQASILSYRADFSISTLHGAELAIECDGHDFHDRTKQQAAADRARDRELLAIGIPTLRFTGSEIVHYADRCAGEIFKIALKQDSRVAWIAHEGLDPETGVPL